MKAFSLALLIILPAPASACMSIIPAPEDLAREAVPYYGFVQIGYVTGTEYPDYEAALIRDGQSASPLQGRHIVRVTFTESLAGDLSGPMTVETPCYSAEPKLGQRAIVYIKNGSKSVLLAEPDYEHKLKEELARLRGR